MKKNLTLLCLAICALSLASCEKIIVADLKGNSYATLDYHSSVLDADIYRTITFIEYGSDKTPVIEYATRRDDPLNGKSVSNTLYYTYEVSGTTINTWIYSGGSDHKGSVFNPFYIIDDNTVKMILYASDNTQKTYTFTKIQK